MQLLQLRSYAFQEQDLYCKVCRHVAKRNMTARCGSCAGAFLPRRARDGFVCRLDVFANVAAFYQFAYLAEVARFLSN